MKLLFAFLALCSLAACSTRDVGHSPKVRRVAVSYSGEVAGEEGSSVAGEVGRRVVNRGASMALGAAGLGWAGDVIDLAGAVARPGKKKAGVSPAFKQQCLLGGVDPVVETARAFERRLVRGRGFTLDARAPEATFCFTIVRADMEAMDGLGQSCRPSLTVRATLVDRAGKTLWQRQRAGVGETHTWREYGAGARLFRAELASAADAVAAGLIAELK